MSNDKSLKKRTIHSLFYNFIKSALNFITSILIARYLGPEDFGRFSFLIVSFSALGGFTNFNSREAFFTFLSEKVRTKRFIIFFWVWILFQYILLLIIVSIFSSNEISLKIWNEKDKLIIFLALTGCFLEHSVWSVALNMAEAQRNTIIVQRINLFIGVMHLFSILMLFYYGILIIKYIFLIIIIEYSVASIIAFKLYVPLDVGNHKLSRRQSLDRFGKMFWSFCKPFILYSTIGFIAVFFDRWMLQNFGGSKEQGFFGISERFSTIILLFTSALIRPFWKEISEANKNMDKNRICYLFSNFSTISFFIGCVGCGFMISWNEYLINIVFSEQYSGAIFTITLMLFFPLYQSLGQINGTMFQATRDTKNYTLIRSVFIILGSIISFFLLAPDHFFLPGLGLGSDGLAIKIVFWQVVQINFERWYLSKKIGINFNWTFQFLTIFLSLGLGLLAKIISLFIFSNLLFAFVSSVIIYLGLIIFTVYLFPFFLGINNVKDILIFFKL